MAGRNRFGKTVDINGKEIKSLAVWKKLNPSSLYFDSNFERECYLLLEKNKLNFEFKPEKRELIPSFQVWALSNNKTGSSKLFKSTVRPLTYTMDFLIKCNNGINIFVESKGFFQEDARIRYKLFQTSLKTNEICVLVYNKSNNLREMKNLLLIILKEFGGSGEFKELKNKNVVI
jgi:hypothetical protein